MAAITVHLIVLLTPESAVDVLVANDDADVVKADSPVVAAVDTVCETGAVKALLSGLFDSNENAPKGLVK